MVGGVIKTRLAEGRKTTCPKFGKFRKTDRCDLEKHPGKMTFLKNEQSVVGTGKIARSIDFSQGFMRKTE